MNKNVQITIEKLHGNHMAGYYVESQKELIELLSTLIPKNSIVGSGDSVTLEELGIFDYLRSGAFTFFDKHQSQLTKEEKRDIYLKNFDVDTFITGSNAITMEGEIFNIDGNGSRVAPMLYGPRQVIVVVGVQKIVPTIKEAIFRTRQIAAPLDAKRLDKQTPCTVLHKCIDCHHKQRICNDFVMIAGQFIEKRIKVIIVNQEVGY